MKKTALSILILIANIFSTPAQEKRINLYGGYVFDDNLDFFYDYDHYVLGAVNGGFQYGGSFEFIVPHEIGIEIMYIGQTTTMPLSFNSAFLSGTRSSTNDINLNYALASINKYFQNGKLEGYGGLILGCLFTNVKNTGILDTLGNEYEGMSTSATRFSWGVKLGANIWIMENVGIKTQVQFISTSEGISGSGYYANYGSYYGYYSYINMFQWSFSSGLVFRIGGNK